MSLVTGMIIKDGIVLCSDSRGITSKTIDNKEIITRISDAETKITPITEKIIITETGNAIINKNLTTDKFLNDLKRKTDPNIDIGYFGLNLLNEYTNICDDNKKLANFYIWGYNKKDEPVVYNIDAYEKTISNLSIHKYGYIVHGCSDIAEKMLSEIDFKDLNLTECIELSHLILQTNIDLCKYKAVKKQNIGGKIQTYIMDNINNKYGWLVDHKIIPDNEYLKY